MNVIISNQNNKITDSLNIEVIKTLSGEFSLDELTSQLVNFYYNKIVVDITAIKNHYDITSVINFLKGFEPNRIIILLNDSEVVNSPDFLSKIVEEGYYNFTRNSAGVNYLIDNPNSYEDVKHYVRTSDPYSLNPTYSAESSQKYEENNYEPIKEESFDKNNNQIIIGVQNLTEHAGATTLAYMMVRQLKYNYSVKGIEMNKQDFIYFRDNDLVFCTSIDDFKLRLKEFSKVEVIIIDLNDFDAKEYCDKILYLVDPGVLKLNKLLKKDSNVHSKTRNGKIILNRSSLKEEDLSNFEYETKFKVFFNINNFDDRRERLKVIDEFLFNLGFKKQNPENMGFFGNIFKKN